MEETEMAGATMAIATVTAALPLRVRVCARSRRGQARCAVSSDATEAPAVPSARLSADCVIVGGGISGLCTAQALATKYGVSDLLVTEARARPGGNITTVERPDEGYLWEEGPNSFQPSDPVLTMAVDSGLKDDLVFGDPNAPRFVLWRAATASETPRSPYRESPSTSPSGSSPTVPPSGRAPLTRATPTSASPSSGPLALFSKMGAFPVFVVDGQPSPLKSQARAARFFRGFGIDAAASMSGQREPVKGRNAVFTRYVVDCVELLRNLGMPVLRAKGEAFTNGEIPCKQERKSPNRSCKSIT